MSGARIVASRYDLGVIPRANSPASRESPIQPETYPYPQLAVTLAAPIPG